MIFLLLVVELILVFFAFKIHDKDVIAPSVIVCLFYFGSCFLAALNYNRYAMQIHANTFALVSGALLLFVIVSALTKVFVKETGLVVSSPKPNYLKDDEPIDYSKILLIIFVIINIIVIIWQIRWVKSVIGSGGEWSKIMFEFRNTNSTYSMDTIKRPEALSNLQLLCQISAYIYGYIFTYNFVRVGKKAFLKHFDLLLPVLLYCLIIMLNAGRGTALMIIMQLVILGYVLFQQKNGWKTKFSYKFITILLVGIVLLLLLFSATRFFVGRASTLNTFEYISQYAGAAIKNLDLFMQDNMPRSEIWGKETFGAIHNQLANLIGRSDWNYIRHLEFRTVNGNALGNVYGALRYYYHDFGALGVVVFVSLCSFVMTFLYYKVKQYPSRPNKSVFSFKTLIFAYLCYALFMYPISESFVNLIVSRANIKLFIGFYLLKCIIIDNELLGVRLAVKKIRFRVFSKKT